MSSEYPPVIIDSVGLCDDAFFGRNDAPSLVVRSAAFGGGSEQTATPTASTTELYLIRDNRLYYQGAYQPNEIKLVYGAGPERTMAAGSSDMIPGAESGLDAGAAVAGETTAPASTQVTEITLPNAKEPLRLGRDFHNFILILRREYQAP